MGRKHAIILIFLLFCPTIFNVYGQEMMIQEHHEKHRGTISFIENKGQWEDFIKFKSEMRGGALFFEPNRVTFSFTDPEYFEKIQAIKFGATPLSPESSITCYAYRMNFLGANDNPVAEGYLPFEDYNNYYIGDDPKKWASNVKKYGQIKYTQLYQGIDLLFYEYHHTYKYEFILKSGANPDLIRIQYEGADKISLKNKNLIIKIGKHETVERSPYAYQLSEKGEKEEVECRFVLDGKVVRFVLGKYDANKPLIIDPQMVFSSYSGSTADNWGATATYDHDGNLYGSGIVQNNGAGRSYPVTLGAFQMTHAGAVYDWDIGITKFNPTGSQRLFSTYLGGSSTDFPHSLVVNSNNELYVLATTSSSNFPTTPNAYMTTFQRGTAVLPSAGVSYQNGSAVTISRFNSTGTMLLNSTFFGGSGNDGLNMSPSLAYNYADEIRGEIQLDASENVYIVSSTSSTNLPTTQGVFQPTYGGGAQDGFIAKFSYNLQSLIWCSYFGGNGADAIYSMELDAANNIYICGGTMSSNLPTTFGAISPSPLGSEDGFVAKIASNGNAILASTYYGRNGYDQVYLVTLDEKNNVVVVGQTDASGSSWINNAAWSNGNGQFISKLSNNLDSVIWSTSFGNVSAGPNISPAALMVDPCGDIHISGWGSYLFGRGRARLSTIGMPLVNPIQPSTDGNDFYFMSISGDASNLKFGSFFGGGRSEEHVDGGTSRYDKQGCIYQAVCAGCHNNNDFPIYPSKTAVVGDSNRSGLCNLGVIKMDLQLQYVYADFSMPNVACVGIIINFTNKSKGYSDATKYFWNFGDGTTDTAKNPTHVYLNRGRYTITLIVTDSNSCNYADTSKKDIIIGDNKSDTLQDINVCKGDFTKQIGIQSSPDATYEWFPKIGLSDYYISNPIFRDTVSRIYMLIVSNPFCTDTFFRRVNVITMPLPKNTIITRCVGDSVRFAIDSLLQMDYYIWSSNPLYSDTLNRPTSNQWLNIKVNQNVTYYSLRNKAGCEVRDTLQIKASSFQISLDKPPKACLGDTIGLNVNILNQNNSTSHTYRWQPTANIVGNSQTSKPLALPQKPMYYTVSVTNEHNCTMRDSVFVDIIVLIPNIVTKQISCFGMIDGSISINMHGGNEPYLYRWFNTYNDTSCCIYNLQKGLYRVQITDSNNCTIDTSILIIEPPVLTLVLQNIVDTVYCDGICMGQALAVASGGTPPYSYTWITGDTTALLDSLCAGKYTLWLSDHRGCRDTVFFDVKDTSSMEVDTICVPASCYNVCDGSVQIVIIEAALPCVYIWKTGGYTTDFVDNLCRGIYDVSVTDAQRCTRRIFPVVGSPPPIVVDSSVIIHPYCLQKGGGHIEVYIKGGIPPYTYYWDSVQGTNILSDLEETRAYMLTVIDSNGCRMDTSLFLLNFDTLSIKYQTGNIPCEDVCNGSAAVFVSGGLAPYTYIWSDSSKTSTIKNLCEGEYEVTAYDSNKCWITTKIFVFVDTNLFPAAVQAWSDLATIYRSQSTIIYGSNYGSGFDYTWSPSDYLSTTKGTKTTSTPLHTITYTYTVTDTNGCIVSDTILITVLDVICDEPYIFVPNAFTPNGDGLNDILYVRGNVLEKVDFAIYDRWGEKIFETKNKDIGWDGTFRGKPCDPGVYVYYLDAACIGGMKYHHKGNITLIR